MNRKRNRPQGWRIGGVTRLRRMSNLAGQVAVVTGASGNLGPVWIGALAAAGATVVGLDVAPAEVEGAVSVEVADVRDREAVAAAQERIAAAHGVPDVLVNNAGVDQPPGAAGGRAAVEDIALDDFRRVL